MEPASKNILQNQTSATETVVSVNGYSRNKRRLVLKNGTSNIEQLRSNSHWLEFLEFSQLVNASWTFTTFTFMVILFWSWLLFAVIWWLICYTHGDFEPNHLPPLQEKNNFTPCVYNVHDFASCFLFSIETHHTVGYGTKATTNECPEAIFVNAGQCIIGFITQGFFATIIFAKMVLPRLRSETLLFSKKAIIRLKNDKLYLTFRIGDMRKNNLIDVNVKGFYIRSEYTKEGHILPHHQTQLMLSTDKCKSSVFFNWPVIFSHEIDENSPLYHLSPTDLMKSGFEIVVVLEGTIHSTGQSTQAKTSYLPSEIMWGCKFQQMITFDSDRKEYRIDFSKFDCVKPMNTPWLSAFALEQRNLGVQVESVEVSSKTSQKLDDDDSEEDTDDGLIMNCY